MQTRMIVLLLSCLIGLARGPMPASGQDPAPGPAAAPVPRGADGRVHLGPLPGEKGHWSRTRRELVIGPDAASDPRLPVDLRIPDVPFQPWTQALWDYHRSNSDRDAPHARCKPSGGPRQIGTAYGFEIVDFPELQRMFIFDIGGPHTYRIIHMDGRTHPPDLEPSYYGHSIGYWEGDTLVVDTVGFNERSWIDTEGLVRTEQAHQIERFTRLDFDTLRYEVTIDDPGAYRAPWTAGSLLRWNPGAEMFEYICQDNNKNPEMTVDDQGRPLSRTSRIVP